MQNRHAALYEVSPDLGSVRVRVSSLTAGPSWHDVVRQLSADARVSAQAPILLDAWDASSLSLADDLPELAACWARLAPHPVAILLRPESGWPLSRQLALLVTHPTLFTDPAQARGWLARQSTLTPQTLELPDEDERAGLAARREPSAIHLSRAPEATYLLGLQLEQEALSFPMRAVSSREDFLRALADPTLLIVADLPLPWPEAEADLSTIQRTRPDVPVVFRWGDLGTWNIEAGSTQLGRSVRQALSMTAERQQTPDERRAVLTEVVRFQTAHLELAQLDGSDPDMVLRRALEIMAETTDVARVGLWWVQPDRDALTCDVLYDRRSGFLDGGVVVVPTAYRHAIEEATFVAAHDAVQDPRTSALAADYLVPNGISSMLDAPVRRGGRVVGIVCLEHVGPLRQWTVVEQCAAAAFASTIGRLVDMRERRRVDAQWEELKRLDVLGRMAGAIAHDFSNLATVVAGTAEGLLEEDGFSASQRSALEAIGEAGRSATDLVKQLLALAKSRPGEVEPLNVSQELRTLHPVMQRLLGSAIECSVSAEAELWVLMDRSQLHRVVLNLAANARDALPTGGTFSLAIDAIDGTDDQAVGAVRLRATDNGRGIAATVLPHLFTPFFTTKADKGTGLGLATVRAIVEQARGTITVASHPGRTCFSIVLPRHTASVAAVQSANPQASSPPARPSGTIVVVDDDVAVRELMRRMLERWGWTVLAVAGAAQAMDAARALGDRLTLLITDLHLAGMSGIDLITSLRTERPQLRVLLVSGELDAHQLLRPDDRSATLTKPFSARVFGDRVNRLLHDTVTRLHAVEDVAKPTVLVMAEFDGSRESLRAAVLQAGHPVLVAESQHDAILALGGPVVAALVAVVDTASSAQNFVASVRAVRPTMPILVANNADASRVDSEHVRVIASPLTPQDVWGFLATLRVGEVKTRSKP